MLFLYFIIFILVGLFLHLLRNYDLFTISIVYIIASFFLYFIDIYAVLYLILFFTIAEGITSLLNKKHEKRNYKNIIGNCIASVIFFVIGLISIYFTSIPANVFALAALAGISAAFSDTLSSEIGRLNKSRPVLITNLKKVRVGEDGAISFLGILAALLGSLITALYFIVIGYALKVVIILAISGIVGSIIDSYIGATIERKGKFTNNQTNFSATFITGLIAIVLFMFI